VTPELLATDGCVTDGCTAFSESRVLGSIHVIRVAACLMHRDTPARACWQVVGKWKLTEHVQVCSVILLVLTCPCRMLSTWSVCCMLCACACSVLFLPSCLSCAAL
jgi:hypothetical protein